MIENHRKVSFNIASEASYVNILSKKNPIENAKKMVDLASFESLKLMVKHDNFLIGQILVKNS